MNQIEINKIVTVEGEEPIYTVTTDREYGPTLFLDPSQMKELKEKIAKLDL